MKAIIPFAHDLLKQYIQPGSVVVDATLGNGHDSLYLSQLVGHDGRVIAFDVQQEAIDTSSQWLQQHDVSNVDMILSGHEHAVHELTQRGIQSIDGAIFNLGYLPGSNKHITTSSQTTIQAIKGLFSILKDNRIIVIVIYPGHDEGKEERDALMNVLKQIPANHADIAKYQMVNRSESAPFVIGIYKNG
ncbi:tRNA (mnm(5)s(2)U34)-methyltransferase [Tenuibacillus multivorans]|uniref:Putative rRNA methylase n=1 Tax=Tenuibacillus multivorans TaxID=237069 RepID=A0A1H0FPR2_9BACI|nr:class I SAM-dependent methyltransferase [Tenuibacillus multivorans]GEL77940.1 rRNA methyltransferase [Tenuibacillus multivorans]SDN96521.1 Putative rRNA methylase [Tenuibacillus multivorans]